MFTEVHFVCFKSQNLLDNSCVSKTGDVTSIISIALNVGIVKTEHRQSTLLAQQHSYWQVPNYVLTRPNIKRRQFFLIAK